MNKELFYYTNKKLLQLYNEFEIDLNKKLNSDIFVFLLNFKNGDELSELYMEIPYENIILK